MYIIQQLQKEAEAEAESESQSEKEDGPKVIASSTILNGLVIAKK